MGQLGESLAQRFEQTNNDVIQAVEQCSDSKWQAKTAPEGWPVAVTAHHIAGSHEVIGGLVQAIANGQPLPPLTPEMLDQMNAQHAQQFANCSKPETISMLREGGAKAVSALRGLSDEQLQRSAPFMGQTFTAQQMAENVLIGHPQMHGQSIRAAQ